MSHQCVHMCALGWVFLGPEPGPWASQVVLVVKNLSASSGDVRHAGSIPGSGRPPEGGHGNPFQYLPGELHGQRSLENYNPWGHKQSDMPEDTYHTHKNLGLKASPRATLEISAMMKAADDCAFGMGTGLGQGPFQPVQ